jgi:hypothetical protein
MTKWRAVSSHCNNNKEMRHENKIKKFVKMMMSKMMMILINR